MAEARAAIAEPHVKFHEEGTSIIEQEEKVAKSLFYDLKLCAFRTRYASYIILSYLCSVVVKYFVSKA